MFSPKTFQDRLDELAEGAELPDDLKLQRFERVPGRVDVVCSCRSIVQTWRMVDVRSLPDNITRGEKFACDGCWTRWIRERKLTKSDWLELLGAPAELVAKFRGTIMDRIP